MNTADSEGIARKLLAAGYVEESLERADIAILNTCVVRQASEERVYSKLHELRQWKTPERTIASEEKYLVENGLVKRGDHLVLVSDIFAGQDRLDSIQLRRVP